jgi:hypothetical protein
VTEKITVPMRYFGGIYHNKEVPHGLAVDIDRISMSGNGEYVRAVFNFGNYDCVFFVDADIASMQNIFAGPDIREECYSKIRIIESTNRIKGAGGLTC